MTGAQSAVLGLTLVLVVYLGSRVQQLESRVDALQSAQMTTVLAEAGSGRSGSPSTGDRRLATRVIRSTPSSGDAAGGAATVSTIDDHLWSDDGRQAIGDIVEEREDADRERRTERWKKMAEYRTQKTVEAVSEKLNLSEGESEEITALVTTYMEIRSSRWKKMSDDDVDIEQAEREYEESKAEIEQEIAAVIGDEGLELLHEEMQSGWR